MTAAETATYRKRWCREASEAGRWSRDDYDYDGDEDEDGDDDTHNTCTALYATIRGEKEEEKEEKGEEEKKGVGG